MTPRRAKIIVAVCTIVVLVLGTSCGYLSSGTWTDDPKNYKRAWGVSKPPEVTMVHSWYWRSPHFTREESYFFEFRKHEELLKSLVAENRMTPWTAKPGAAPPRYCFDKPAWFSPKPPSAYDIWTEHSGSAWIFSDKSSGELFVYVCQL